MVITLEDFNQLMQKLESIEEKINELEKRYTAEQQASEAKKKEVDLSDFITDKLKELGIPMNIKGFHYTKQALILTYDAPIFLGAVSKDVYPAIAKHFQTTPSRVERAIRHSIDVVYANGNFELLNELFGYTVSKSKGRPSNSEFLATICDYIRRSYRA